MKYSEFLKANASGSDYVFLIAEIGKNFIDVEVEETESVLLSKAIRLVKAAKKAGADAVKFQTHCVADEVLPLEFSSPHFAGVDRYRWVKRNEEATSLNGFWRPLKNACQSIGIEFFSTPMSKGAAIKLEQLGVNLWKVGSADLSDYLLTNFLISTGKPIIVSSGMVSLQELKTHISTYARLGSRPAILYCVSKYPCQPSDFNMATIQGLTKTYPANVIGFSDHSVNSHFPALCAVKLGARIIEKHFTMDRNAWGSDHKASLMPKEYADMVEAVRNGVEGIAVPEAILGEFDRELEGATNIYRKYFEKGLVIASPLRQGDRFEIGHFSAMRPHMHIPIPASELFNILGAKATRDISIGEILTSESIERFL
jgi:sialic acid synthase SpsE